MAEWRVSVDPQAVAAFIRSPNGPVVRYFIVQGERVKQEAQRLVGVYQPPPAGPSRARRPGTLRDEIVKRFKQTPTGFVIEVGVFNDPVALWHHEGTQPHIIVPRRATRLVFWSGRAGRVVYAKRVSHPGTRPNRFLVNALAVLGR